MKRILLFLLLVLSFYANAQLINKAEYFIDSDPGNGNGIDISVTANPNSTTFSTAVSTAGLTPGFHSLFTRARYDNGIWSFAESRSFWISVLEGNTNDIATAEFFIDTDPGQGNGTAMSVGATGSSVSFVSNVPTTGLSGGFHSLFVRAKNVAGVWSLVESRVFFISILDSETNDIVAAEYFIDTDPGQGNGTGMSVGTAGPTVSFTGTVATTGIMPGFHNLFIRVKNAVGVWGLSEQRTFYVSEQALSVADVSGAEFFIDTDPGVGKGTALNIGTPGSSVNFIADIPTTGLAAGKHYLFIRAYSTDGWGPFEQREFTVGAAVAPAKPTIVSISGKTSPVVTNLNKPPFIGKAEANSTVEIFSGATSLGTIVTNASGDWGSFIPASAIADGTYNITVTAKNSANLTSVPSDIFILTIDTQTPIAPIIVSIDEKTIQGFSTNNAKPIMVGTAEALATVELFSGAASLGTTATNASGAYSFTPLSALPDGNYVITAKAKDLAGNISVASNAFSFKIDNLSPLAPVIVSVNNITIQNQIINNNKPPIAGTAEPNSTVQIFRDTTSLGFANVDAVGKYTFIPTVALPDGAINLRAKTKDAAGNTSELSPVFRVVIKTAAPLAPVIVSVDGKTTQGFTISKTNPTVAGTAEALSTVEIFNGSTSLGNTTTDAAGNYSFIPASLADGNYALTAKAKDLAGNISVASNAFSFKIDNLSPLAPVIVSVNNITIQNQIINNNKPPIAGTAEPNSTVQIFRDTTSLGFANVDAAGKYTFIPTVALPDGAVNLRAKTKDAAGNTSELSPVFRVVIKTTVPLAPVIVSVDGKTTQGFTISKTNPTVAGTAEALSTVEIFNGSTSLGNTTTDAAGNYSFIPASLADGNYALTAKAKDVAGNISVASNVFSFKIDNSAPLAPVIVSVNNITIQNQIINNNKPPIAGTAEPNSTVQIFRDTTSLGFANVDAVGKYTFIPTVVLPDGAINLRAKTKDAAGNTSELSPIFRVIIKTTTPVAPVIVSVDGKTTQGFTTSINRPVVLGTAENNATVEIFNGSLSLGLTVASSSGNYAFTPTVDLPVGDYVLTARSRDIDNNLSALSNSFAFTIASSNKEITANNVLTPNGDGKNDFLTIANIELYPLNKLTIYDRAGRIIHAETHYKNTWDGRVNGNILAEDTYYYHLDLGNGLQAFKSFITVIRKNK